MARDAEPVQQKGMDGVARAKRWLESTTWIELPFRSYTSPALCRLSLLNERTKLYDLAGHILTEPPTPLYVEAKDYDSTGGKQQADYTEFLVNAYSATARDIKNHEDADREFMWVTTHPFSLGKWTDQLKPSTIREALDARPEVLAGENVDDDVLKLVSERLWLLVVHEKQERFMLTPRELSQIEALLNRKKRK